MDGGHLASTASQVLGACGAAIVCTCRRLARYTGCASHPPPVTRRGTAANRSVHRVSQNEAVANGSTGSTISIILVDDHPLFRDAVKRVLDRESDFKVVAETGEGQEAVRLAVELHPSVVILDIGLRGVSGLEAVRQIKAECPTTAVLALTVHDDAEHVRSMLQGGASGFLTKDVLGGEIVEAIRRVVAGEIYLCAVALRHVVDSAISTAHTSSEAAGPRLTTREFEVLSLLAQGLSNNEIAQRLGVSTRTVKGHLEELFAKLEVDSRTAAVTAALRLGILGMQDLQ